MCIYTYIHINPTVLLYKYYNQINKNKQMKYHNQINKQKQINETQANKYINKLKYHNPKNT